MYIPLISIHGLIRARNIEMGRDADTGGQVRYVLELAKTLATFDEVEQVDLFTRRIRDKRVSNDYAETIEELGPKCRLIRLPCGGGKYMRKEKLWPYLDDYVDGMVSFIRNEGRSPTVVHGHYADAGYVAKEVAAIFDVPFIFTGHSLGKPKLNYLLEEGWSHEQADKELNIDRRINVEQECLAVADMLITSTRHERDNQWGHYEQDGDAHFQVIPPGTDLERFFPYYDYDLPHHEVDEHFKQARIRMCNDLKRFHFDPEKPLILALCRPDRRKNIGALVKAYGESKELQAIANLAVFAGIRTDIESMPDNEQRVLTDMLLMMDRYDLYGKMAIPKNHDSEFDVPELYRITASRHGIFVNSAFIELFGLTAIEASATGLPFVVTENGGPQDIVENCESGILVNVNDQQQLTDAMLQMLTDREKWEECSNNGVNLVRKHYAWETHCSDYLKALKEVIDSPTRTPSAIGQYAPGKRIASLEGLLISDLDNTLLGDDGALNRLLDVLRENRDRIGFGVASGRSPELVREVLQHYGILDDIDVIIASVGSEILYGREQIVDKGFASQLRVRWKADRIREALDPFSFLALQNEPHTQREFKISYNLDESVDAEEALAQIHEALNRAKTAYTLIFSHGTFIDILPHRASKGKAVRYLSNKWNLPIEKIATAGDSGNDRDMLVGQTSAIVVANHSEELAALKQEKSARIYFAKSSFANGIMEGLQYYGLLPQTEQAAVQQAS